uniref:Reverse transcriptase Ty1/copia-type domain-containing protein n=1 Tax=Fagus sylvatica TaxID=28930 RepID=A0A2N9EX91_FAGSY
MMAIIQTFFLAILMAPNHDQLILNAVIGSILPTIIPFIAQATTSRQAWTILANTYAKPSRGRIKQIKNQLKNTTKGSLSVTEFMQTIKTRADDLALLGASLDEEEITDKILDGLGDEYKELVPTANPTYRTNNKSWRPSQPQGTTTTNWRPSYNSPNRSPAGTTTGSRNPPRPYLVTAKSAEFKVTQPKGVLHFALYQYKIPLHPTLHSRAHHGNHKLTLPPIHTHLAYSGGQSHHVTSDLDNLSLHTPYIGTDDIMIGDGSNLPITHTGSTSLKTSQHTFTLDNVLCALHTGTILLQGQTKDGVYEWPTSSPFTAFSTIKTTSFDWHHRLGHPAFSILKHIVSSNHLGSSSSLSSDFSFSGPSSIPHSNPINTWIPAPIKVMSSTSQPPLNMPSEGFTPQQTQSAASTSIPIQPPSTNTAQNTQTTTPSLTSSTNTTPPLHNPPETTTLPTHTMTTRAKNNIHKPITKMNLHTQLSKSNGLEPTTVTKALLDPKWRKAMSDECDALVKNGTWELVPPNSTQNIVGCKWIFRIKRNSDGSIDRFKARLVAKGFHQRPGVDYLDTFSPVVKPTTVRVVLSLAVSRGWSLRQLDVNNAFLQGHLSETVHMQQPPGFVDQDHPSYVCKLRKAIYGLKQAPRAWYHELRTFLLSSGFKNSHADTSLFVLTTAAQKMYILVYVDDLIITGDNNKMIDSFVDGLAHRFSIKDLGQLSYFLGVEVVQTARFYYKLVPSVGFKSSRSQASNPAFLASLTLRSLKPFVGCPNPSWVAKPVGTACIVLFVLPV